MRDPQVLVATVIERLEDLNVDEIDGPLDGAARTGEVQDRHHENWGVIVQRGRESAPPRFAPLYDSARGLFCNITDEYLGKFFGAEGDRRLDRYVENSRPLVGFAGLSPAAGRRHLAHDELLSAVYRHYPPYRQLIRSVIVGCDLRRINSALKRRLMRLCMPQRRVLMLACLRKRRDALLRAIDATGL